MREASGGTHPLLRLGRRLPPSWRAAIPKPGKRLVVLAMYSAAVRRRPKEALQYLLSGRELENFTYEIANADELVEFLAT